MFVRRMARLLDGLTLVGPVTRLTALSQFLTSVRLGTNFDICARELQ